MKYSEETRADGTRLRYAHPETAEEADQLAEHLAKLREHADLAFDMTMRLALEGPSPTQSAGDL